MDTATYTAISGAVASGGNEYAECRLRGEGVAAFRRWRDRVEMTGGDIMNGLQELPRTGRPRKVEVTDEEADYLARLYMRSNRGKSVGSMSMCAYVAAVDTLGDSPLRPEVRRAILETQERNPCAVPTAVKEAMRLSRREVARYRNPKDGLNNGIYVPGWLRMADDGSRMLVPGEKQVWDDASVNLAVTVPWERGGDECSRRYGVRLGRFQLLLGIDCATDFCMGFGYTMRSKDSYNNWDVRSTMHKVWELNGYAPDQCVMEGGPWQARNTLDFLDAAGVKLVSAKGRPNQKLVEGYFNRLWTALSIVMPKGQVGRYQGEMAKENEAWMACREGRRDPRRLFPKVEDLMNGLRTAIVMLNEKRVSSKIYGKWVPCEAYGAARNIQHPISNTECPSEMRFGTLTQGAPPQPAALAPAWDPHLDIGNSVLGIGHSALGHPLPDGLRAFVMPVRKETTLRRSGVAAVTAETPYAFDYEYLFAWPEGYKWEGARVSVAFDPADIQGGAEVTLAKRWQETPAGTRIASAVPCVSPAPMLWQAADGLWQAATLDARAGARGVKRSGRALIGAQVAALDERGRGNVQYPISNTESPSEMRPAAMPRNASHLDIGHSVLDIGHSGGAADSDFDIPQTQFSDVVEEEFVSA